MLLIDTSVLVALMNHSHLRHNEIANKIIHFFEINEPLFLAPQGFYEYYTVATRPNSFNGLGLTIDLANEHLIKFRKIFKVLPENDQVLGIWIDLVKGYQISGKPSHDAHLVASMLANGIHKIHTLNPKDFRRFEPAITLVE